MAKCDACKHKEDFFVCDVCIHEPELKDRYEPLTNGDKIRAMSDAELAEFLGHSNLCVRIQHGSTWCEEHAICEGCLEEWLKQPWGAEDGK